MVNNRRTAAIVIVVIFSLAGISFFGDRIAETIYPRTPGPIFPGFDGEIRPGGQATNANFAKLRPGMARHEVWSVLGPSAGIEGWHEEWWHQADFTIWIWYNSPGDLLTRGGELKFKDGRKTLVMAK